MSQTRIENWTESQKHQLKLHLTFLNIKSISHTLLFNEPDTLAEISPERIKLFSDNYNEWKKILTQIRNNKEYSLESAICSFYIGDLCGRCAGTYQKTYKKEEKNYIPALENYINAMTFAQRANDSTEKQDVILQAIRGIVRLGNTTENLTPKIHDLLKNKLNYACEKYSEEIKKEPNLHEALISLIQSWDLVMIPYQPKPLITPLAVVGLFAGGAAAYFTGGISVGLGALYGALSARTVDTLTEYCQLKSKQR